jgi:hypothetical protein
VSSAEPAGQVPSPADIQAQIASAREDLAATLAELRAATTPGALAKRGLHAVGGWFTDEHGGIRPERVAIAGAVVASFVAVAVLRRSRRR